MKISKYKIENEDDILTAIRNEPDWDMFTNDDAIDIYRKSLENCATYVCYNNSEFCGYLRALIDDGFAVYISELYVIPKWRNHKIGQSLIEQINFNFSKLTVYVLSDEDTYYEKKGYKKIGSVFKI